MTLLCCLACADYLKFERLPEGRDLIHEIRKHWKNTDYQFGLISSSTVEAIDPCELCGDTTPGSRKQFDVYDDHLKESSIGKNKRHFNLPF